LLGWSQEQLATASGVSRRTIAAIERQSHPSFESSLLAVREIMEKSGVLFHSAADRQGVTLLLR
jgi:transcriptional regulator with XRE-family HTH domain